MENRKFHLLCIRVSSRGDGDGDSSIIIFIQHTISNVCCVSTISLCEITDTSFRMSFGHRVYMRVTKYIVHIFLLLLKLMEHFRVWLDDWHLLSFFSRFFVSAQISQSSIHFKRFLHELGKDKFLKCTSVFVCIWSHLSFLNFMSFCAHICQLGLCESQRLKRVFVASVHFTRPTLRHQQCYHCRHPECVMLLSVNSTLLFYKVCDDGGSGGCDDISGVAYEMAFEMCLRFYSTGQFSPV